MSRREEMKKTFTTPGRELLGGTIRIFSAEALLVPTGVLTAAYLSRRFGPGVYGLLTLASLLVVWVESNVATALSQTSIKLVGNAGVEWQPVATAMLRLYLLAGCALGLTLWAAATPLASLLGEPALAAYLWLLAIDVPLFCAAQAHRNVVVGLGHFRQRALISAARWIARLLFVVVFVELSGSPLGALWGGVCASLVEVLVCRLYVRPSLFGSGAYSMRRLCGYAMPLVASAICLSLFSRLDLFMLKALGATASGAGLYGGAQNLALLPSLLSFALAPALLSTLSRALRDGDEAVARSLGRQAMRAVLLMLPFAAILAGAAPEIIALIFGRDFLAAAPLLRVLIFGSLALLMISVTTSILTSAGKRRWTLHVAWPLLLGATAGHMLLIPVAGAAGAAVVTTMLACAGAATSIALVRRIWRVAPSARTLWRSVVVSALAYGITALPPASGPLLAPKLLCVSVFVVAALYLLGEFNAEEIGAARMMLRRFRRRAGVAVEAPGRAL